MRAERVTWLRRAQTLTGLWLVAFVAHHIALHWSALSGREAWVDRVAGPVAGVHMLSWTLPFLLYAVLGLACLRLERGAEWAPTDPLRTPRLVAGALACAFLVLHVAQVWVPSVGPHTSPRESYEALWHGAGRPAVLMVHVVGLSGVSMYGVLACDRLLAELVPVARGRVRQAVRYGLGIVGFVGWGLCLHLLGHFALGDGLLPTGTRVPRVQPRTGDPIELSPTDAAPP